jgi:hypothetical protein
LVWSFVHGVQVSAPVVAALSRLPSLVECVEPVGHRACEFGCVNVEFNLVDLDVGRINVLA